MKVLILLLVASLSFANANESLNLLPALTGNVVHLGLINVFGNSFDYPYPPYTEVYYKDIEATRRLRNLIENLRPLFPFGLQDILPLDPLHKSVLTPLKLGSATYYVSNFTLRGLKRFQIDDFYLRTQYDRRAYWRPDFNVTFPNLSANADVLLDFNPTLPLTFKSRIRLVFYNVRMTGALAVFSLDGGDYSNPKVGADDVVVNLYADDATVQMNAETGLLGLLLEFPKLHTEVRSALIQSIGKVSADLVRDVTNNIAVSFFLYQIAAFLGLGEYLHH